MSERSAGDGMRGMDTEQRPACGRCGKDPAEGFATRQDIRYCHGDETPSCYELQGIDEWEQRMQDNARDIVRSYLGLAG